MPLDGPADVARLWLAKAQTDARTIEILSAFGDPPPEALCFHAQQLAEKCLKALLSFRGTPFPRTHDLSALVVRAGSGISFAAEHRDLVELSHLAVAARYPSEPDDVTPDVAKRAVATGLRVQTDVQRALEAEGYR